MQNILKYIINIFIIIYSNFYLLMKGASTTISKCNVLGLTIRKSDNGILKMGGAHCCSLERYF